MFESDSYERIYQPTVVENEGHLTIRGLDDDLGETHNMQQPLVNRSSVAISAAAPPATRRGPVKGAKSLMERMHNIVSIYIPSKDNLEDDDRVLMGDDAQERLMNSGGIDSKSSHSDAPSVQITPSYIFHRVLDLKNVMFEDGYSLLNDPKTVFSLTSICHKTLFCTMVDDEHLFKIHLHETNTSLENDNKSVIRGERITMEWRGNRFIPHHVMYNNLSHLFISGTLQQQEVNQNMLVITDLNGIIVHVSRQYDFPRFGALSGDVDGRIFVVHPQLKADSHQSGLSKMRPNFSEKSFCLFFGTKSINYSVEYIAGHCLGGMSWVSAKREVLTQKDTAQESEQQINRRLLGFNCCRPPNVSEGAKPNEWLHFNSWSFQGLCPGAIAPLDDKLMVIDAVEGTLNYLIWDTTVERPQLVRVTKPDSSRRILGITTSAGQVLLWTSQSIYEFRFNSSNQDETTTDNGAVC